MTTKPKIILGITSSIAAYKCVDLLRLLNQDFDVFVAITKEAKRFVSLETLQVFSDHKILENYGTESDGTIIHVNLMTEIKGILIAPLSADFGAKMAHGLGNDLLSLLMLRREISTPALLCPSMNDKMFLNPATQRNLNILRSDNYQIMEPREATLACGDYGVGAMPKIETIVDAFKTMLRKNKL